MGKTVKPKRSKLSKRRLERKKQYQLYMEQQRHKAWMLHEMIDEDLRNLHLNKNKKEKEKEKE